jgi:hypothetical protein
LSNVAAQPASIFHPHVLGILALAELVVLLPGIGLEIIEILFTESIAVVLAELQEVAQLL